MELFETHCIKKSEYIIFNVHLSELLQGFLEHIWFCHSSWQHRRRSDGGVRGEFSRQYQNVGCIKCINGDQCIMHYALALSILYFHFARLLHIYIDMLKKFHYDEGSGGIKCNRSSSFYESILCLKFYIYR